MERRGFTLVEVVVATALLLVVGFGLFNVQSGLNADRARTRSVLVRQAMLAYLADVLRAFPPPAYPVGTPFSVSLSFSGAAYSTDPSGFGTSAGLVSPDDGQYSHSVTRTADPVTASGAASYRVAAWETKDRPDTEVSVTLSR